MTRASRDPKRWTGALAMAASLATGHAAEPSMQGGSAPADARDPDAYADGPDHGPMLGMDMDDARSYGRVLLDRFEAVHGRDGNGQALDAQAWFGGDIDRLWLKVDGDRVTGRLGATRIEALWDHAMAPYWSLQTGLRHDLGDGPGRDWAALGVQGLAPYRFDVQATAYVGDGRRTALRLETEYDLRVTQRWVLQPDVKIDIYGRDDRRRSIGSGLSRIEAGLRLRYEITRRLAPYVGVVWKVTFGNTARIVTAADRPARQTEAVVGMRLWF